MEQLSSAALALEASLAQQLDGLPTKVRAPAHRREARLPADMNLVRVKQQALSLALSPLVSLTCPRVSCSRGQSPHVGPAVVELAICTLYAGILQHAASGTQSLLIAYAGLL